MKVIFQSVVDSPIPNMVLKPENLQDEIILNAIINRNGTPNMPDAEYSVISIERNINALQSITLGLNSGNAVNIYQLLLEQDEVASKRTSQLNEADSLDDSYSVMVIKDGRNYKTTLQSILSLLSIPEVPQNLSEYNNDAGFITSSDITSKADLVDGKIPANQLPSYVDDVLEFATLGSFPAAGESGKLYLAIDSNIIYRWTGSTYASTSSPIALGETASTAYRGDRGKTAYDHSQATGNPHGTTAAQVANTPAGSVAATTVQGAINELAGDIVQVETDLNLDEYTIAEAFNLLYRKIISLETIIANGIFKNIQVDNLTTVNSFNYSGAPLIVIGSTAPTSAPDFVGQTYVNTTAPGTVYSAKGNASVSDWKQTSN